MFAEFNSISVKLSQFSQKLGSDVLPCERQIGVEFLSKYILQFPISLQKEARFTTKLNCRVLSFMTSCQEFNREQPLIFMRIHFVLSHKYFINARVLICCFIIAMKTFSIQS